MSAELAGIAIHMGRSKADALKELLPNRGKPPKLIQRCIDDNGVLDDDESVNATLPKTMDWLSEALIVRVCVASGMRAS